MFLAVYCTIYGDIVLSTIYYTINTGLGESETDVGKFVIIITHYVHVEQKLI